MKKKFEVILLEEVMIFLESLDEKPRNKILNNMEKSSYFLDSELFKKLNSDIWEFRTLYQKKHYRLLAFWDKTDKTETLVVTTHGIIKKRSKVPSSEIKRAEEIRAVYFKEKNEDE